MSGIFLSAPRRTGKSTLINEDIIPFLKKKQGAEVIYVDLWSDRSRDPGDLISEAVREHLQRREGAILQWARRGGLDKVNVAGIQLDIAKVGIGSGKTIAKALSELSDATKAMIVLVIDEAQHAITTDAGSSSLFALKAARDQLNGSAHHGFRLIATGSNRDKLSLLVEGKDQAFLNAVLLDLELLGDDYLAWELGQCDGDVKPSLGVLSAAFTASGHKPESLRKALDDLAFRFDATSENVDAIFFSRCSTR
ncbi:AAA family ATPase [Undibacterium arcticum]